ncbi:hypothetical protein L1F30_08095 [Simiduia sp. 21SJ11W-1]|uniref:FliH/SctL family protein n=1 Tax=Simiduia sp. 21SJ11W-1 TaxID=2909669 RepID=UPI00209D273F|nr:FliH/SctL family protein [Simiduia sp. 21SJ11W-1]UTA49485.1 hypothetical protein L1F30_08095 [Simiduia sp. 21SJ11W-1]
MSGASKNYIPADQAAAATTWLLPDIGDGTPIPSAEKEARELQAQAEAAAKEVVEEVAPQALPTADEIEAVFEAARKEGFDAGHTEGMLAGTEEGQKLGAERAYAQATEDIERLKTQLQSLIAELEGPSRQHLGALQKLLVEMLARLAQKLVLTELATPSPHIENLVQACLAQLPALQSGAKPRVTLHPDDLAYLHGESMISDMLSRCDWVADKTISPGGCKVDTPSSHLDAQLETRLNEVLDAFEQGQLGDAEGSTFDDPAFEDEERDGADVSTAAQASAQGEAAGPKPGAGVGAEPRVQPADQPNANSNPEQDASQEPPQPGDPDDVE